jgi:thiol-disulfide isomerase/thioredoxin
MTALLRFLAVIPLGIAAAAFASLGPGDTAPAVLGVAADGSRVKVGQSAGKVTVVTFWASWCGPCKRELPMLEGLQRAGWGRVQVVAINIEEREKFRCMAPLLAPLALRVTHDDGNRAQAAYGVNGIPHMVVIGRDGKVIAVHRGFSEDEIDDLLDEVNEGLAAK